jgi:hypothetical protein
MTWARVQGTSSPSASATFGGAVAIGHLVIVCVASGTTITAVSDTVNTYTLAKQTSGVTFSSIWYTVNTSNTALVVTASGGTFPAISIDEYSFTAGTISTPSTNGGTGVSNSPSCGNVAFTHPALVTGCIAEGVIETLTPATNFVLQESVTYGAGTNYGLQFLTYANAASSPQDPRGTWATSTAWTGSAVAFLSSGDSGGVGAGVGVSQMYTGLQRMIQKVHY